MNRPSRWLAMLGIAALLGCGFFEVPEGIVRATPTNLFAWESADLEGLLGENATCKVRYRGGRERLELFYEILRGGEITATRELGVIDLGGEGFTKRFTVRLEPLPEPEFSDRRLLTVSWAEVRSFTGVLRAIVDDFAPEGALVATAERATATFPEDGPVPVVAFRAAGSLPQRALVSGPFGEDEFALVVRLRVTGEAGSP